MAAPTFTPDHPAVRRLVAGAVAQGLPERVTDPATVAKVAAILGATGAKGQAA